MLVQVGWDSGCIATGSAETGRSGTAHLFALSLEHRVVHELLHDCLHLLHLVELGQLGHHVVTDVLMTLHLELAVGDLAEALLDPHLASLLGQLLRLVLEHTSVREGVNRFDGLANKIKFK